MTKAKAKPRYRVPSMKAIARVKKCGLRAVSTFSGCGGTCLGLKMAGIDVLWASEFVAAARSVYELNHPGVPVDSRDIREVTAQEILDAVDMKEGELDLLEGSPPCASFSTCGKRASLWGEVKKYSERRQRTDDLFFEYARLVRGIRPRVFTAENVSGLVKGVAKGYFKMILAEFRDCGYRVEARLLDAQWLGVPQHRQRLIFVGVRDDLDAAPAYPAPLPYRYTVRDAIGDIETDDAGAYKLPRKARVNDSYSESEQRRWIREGQPLGSRLRADWRGILPGKNSAKYLNLARPSWDKPSPTIVQTGGNSPGTASITHPSVPRKFSIPELKRLSAFPDDFRLTGKYKQQWERLGRAVPPVLAYHIAVALRDRVFSQMDGNR